MTTNPEVEGSRIVVAATEALSRGYQPVPIRKGTKAPAGAGWTHRQMDAEEVETEFGTVESLGLRLGEASAGLVDVDLDHPLAWRLAAIFMPSTAMRTGRVGNPNSHFWYRVIDDVPGYRKYTLPTKPDGQPGGETLVELRSTGGHQTLIPPSVWYPKPGTPGRPENYRWEGEPWGGSAGPTEIEGRHLAVRVASLALTAILIENWPREGSRHDAYLALAGGMLRLGDVGVHPYWSRALPQIIEAIAEATHDKDGATTRVGEVVPTTEAKLKVHGKVQGWTTLQEIIGDQSVAKAKTVVREIEDIVDWKRHLPLPSTNEPLIRDRPDDNGGDQPLDLRYENNVPVTVVEAPINPLDARTESWEPINLEPYLAGEVVVPEPTILRRNDGKAIFYPGRVNSMYGRSESAKSWVAMYACVQEMSIGERVIYVDLEDDPAMTIHRLRCLGAGDDDVRYNFTYLRPEGPHANMQRDTWGNEKRSPLGELNAALWEAALEQHRPGLVVVDGMSVLYGLHGLNTNDVTSTDVITNWLKKVTDNGRRTVIVIDHTSKGAEKGSSPIGSQHKISMVQGAAIQVVPVVQPMPGRLGHVELCIGKDRPGKVREISSDHKVQVAADVFIDSRIEGVTTMTINPPKPREKGEVEIDGTNVKTKPPHKSTREECYDALLGAFASRLEERLTLTDFHRILGQGKFSNSTIARARDDLVTDGIILKSGTTKDSVYWMPDPNQEEGSEDA